MKKIKKFILTHVVPAIITTIITVLITSIIGYMKLAWVKCLFEKILEHKLIVVSVIASIVIIMIIVKKRSSICKFFKWLLEKYYKFIWKITGISKLINLIEKQKDELEEIKREFEAHKQELQKNDGERLYLFLKKICPNGSCTNVEIIIKSGTFKKTKTGYEKYDFNIMYNRIGTYDENKFEIFALGHPLHIPYEELYCWKLDKLKGDKCNPKIHLHLYSAIVLYEKEKITLENLKSEDTKQADITAQGRP